MSYILDALRKAERERRLGTIPGLEHAPGTATLRRSSNRWPLLVAAGLLINALLLGGLYVAWRNGDGPPAAAPVDGGDKRASAPVPMATAVPAESRTDTSPPPVETAAIAAVAPPPPKPLAIHQPPPPLLPPTSPPGDQATLVQPSAVMPDTVSRRTGSGDRVAEDAGFSLTPGQPLPPLFDNLPASFRRSVRPMTLSVHVYSDQPSGRFVFINDQRYTEGQQLSEGPVVKSIEPGGVVLAYQGRRFMLTGK